MLERHIKLYPAISIFLNTIGRQQNIQFNRNEMHISESEFEYIQQAYDIFKIFIRGSVTLQTQTNCTINLVVPFLSKVTKKLVGKIENDTIVRIYIYIYLFRIFLVITNYL